MLFRGSHTGARTGTNGSGGRESCRLAERLECAVSQCSVESSVPRQQLIRTNKALSQHQPPSPANRSRADQARQAPCNTSIDPASPTGAFACGHATHAHARPGNAAATATTRPNLAHGSRTSPRQKDCGCAKRSSPLHELEHERTLAMIRRSLLQ